MRLEGKRAVVTGAAAGIGRAVVEQFLAEGAELVGIDLAPQPTEHARLRWAQFNVSNEEAWNSFAIDQFSTDPLDILVSNAGISGLRTFDQLDLETWRRFQKVNVEAALLGVQALHEAMRRSKAASIINVGSLLGLRPAAPAPAYSASKGALINLTKSLALDFAERGENIRCNLVHPGSTMTEMMSANLGETKEERDENLKRRMAVHPLSRAIGHLPMPEDMAHAITFLASDQARFITGAQLPVDGGASI